MRQTTGEYLPGRRLPTAALSVFVGAGALLDNFGRKAAGALEGAVYVAEATVSAANIAVRGMVSRVYELPAAADVTIDFPYPQELDD